MTSTSQQSCVGCQRHFKRLGSHLAQNAACEAHYTRFLNDKSSAPAIPDSISNIGDATAGSQDFLFQVGIRNRSRLKNLRSTNSSRSGARVEDVNDVVDEDDDEFVFDVDLDNDDAFGADINVDAEADVSEHTEEEGPDGSVLDLYLKLFKLRSNPLGLERFSREEKVHIELLQLLRDLKCPLIAFSGVLKWAANANESGHHFKLGRVPTRKKVISNLYERYNMTGLIPQERKLYLPYSQRIVSMIFFDASEVFASLLSCPTLNRDENYLFHDSKDPFVAPPRSSCIGDINTGRCYSKTYDALIKDKGLDVLLPCIMAMDKTHIDMAGRLQMEPITISHGLLKHTVRRLPIAMRILGYINHSTPPKQSSVQDLDPVFNVPTDFPRGTARVRDPLPRRPDVTWASYLLNEAHMQIQFILEHSGFLRLQKHGFRWNLHYDEKVLPVVFHPYVPFIIGDTEGHDRLCGHYTARFSGVQQLCRICECPTYLTGYSKSKFPHRLPRRINRLVACSDTNELQLLSQNYLRNGFDEVRFGLHNKRGIFGACPGEMLHLISLGWFKYCLQAFSAQAGPTSVALKQYDALCACLGVSLSRQSDRKVPRTNFPKGFSTVSNLMGHEMPGCLLVMLFAMKTTSFQTIFNVGKTEVKVRAAPDDGKEPVVYDDQKLRYANHVTDWITVISYLLTWHEWMKQPTISKKQVRGSHAAVQHLMRMLATVAPRPGGMANNTIKRHLVLHLCEDILDHGVPDNVNSSYAESAHIPLAKITSRNTQKRAVSFTKQAAHRYVENLVVSLASADVMNDIKLSGSTFGGGVPPHETPLDVPLSGKKAGRKFELSGKDCSTFTWYQPRASDNPDMSHLSRRVTKFLADFCMPHMPLGKLPCFTSFTDANGEKYRAHPCFDGKSWNDHALVDWHQYRLPYPMFIHTFVDLSGIPEGKSINVEPGRQRGLTAGLYAVAHTFVPVDEDDIDAPEHLIVHYKAHFQQVHHTRPTLYLVACDSIRSPIVGIADIVPRVLASSPRRERLYLFLDKRKEAWPTAWDATIELCRGTGDLDGTMFEADYEKHVEGSQPPLITVKTAADDALEKTAEKAAKVAEKKKIEEKAAEAVNKRKKAAAARRPAAAPAVQEAPQQVGRSKRKRGHSADDTSKL